MKGRNGKDRVKTTSVRVCKGKNRVGRREKKRKEEEGRGERGRKRKTENGEEIESEREM